MSYIKLRVNVPRGPSPRMIIRASIYLPLPGMIECIGSIRIIGSVDGAVGTFDGMQLAISENCNSPATIGKKLVRFSEVSGATRELGVVTPAEDPFD